MERQERYYHECPECGLLTPWIQDKCDCGYRFRRKLPKDHRLVTAICVLSLLLAFSGGYILSGAADPPAPQPTLVRSAVNVTIPPMPTVAATFAPAPSVAPAPSIPPGLHDASADFCAGVCFKW